MRMVFFDERGRAWRHEAVDLASFKKPRNRRAVRRVVEPHARRHFDRDLFRPPGMLDATPDPMDIRTLDAVIVFKESARPDVGGELIFGHADFAALEVGRLFHPVGAYID